MFRGIIALLVLSAGVWALWITDGVGQSNPFARLAGRNVEQDQGPATAWYDRADGRGRFIFDRSSSPALIWPDGSDEVYAVSLTRASGGGEVWLTDTDRVLLRFSNLGGATYFPADAPDGVIAEAVGRAQTLVAPPASAAELQAAARTMVDGLARLSRNEVRAELTEVGPSENAYIVDAMRMVGIGAAAASRRSVRDLEVVRIGVGEASRVRYTRGVLDISVAPRDGYGGRPSSDAIRRALDTAG